MKKDELDFLRESNNIEKEWDDMSLQDAILAWQFIKNCEQLTVDCILQVHRILMEHRDTIEDDEKGVFRNGTVYIGGREGRPWFSVPYLIEEWVDKVNEALKLDKEDAHEHLVHVLHVQYENIHPFFDGNGRSGRIFYNWQRIKVGLPIHVIAEATKNEYYEWFR